jgi:hypothetical protein
MKGNSPDEMGRTVYAAKLRDGRYGMVEAVSWRDAKRYFGRAALSIRKRLIPFELWQKATFDPEARRRVYEWNERHPVEP